MRKVFTTASVILLGIASALAAVPENQDPASASPVGWKPSGHELKDAPPLKTGASRLRTVPTKAQIFGSDSVRGQSETSPSVSPAPQARKASGDGGADETGRKAQALLIFSDTKKATNSIIELPLTPGTVNYFDVVADNVPPMPYKSYGEAVVNAVEFDGLFMASTFCDMLYSQTNSVYTVSDWEHQYNYDYRAADLETTALAYNPADGLCYGVFQGTNPSSGNEEWFFGKWVDPSSYTRPEVISWLGSDTLWYGMAISPEGVIYAIDGECNLVTLDAQTGEVKLIGSTGLQNQYKTSACYDAENGRILFATSLDSGSSFNAIDPTTGRATMLYAMPDGEQIVGLFIPAAPVPDKAPAAAVNLKADFELGSLTGNICFDVPSTYHDGTPASGTVTYEVRLNGTASGTGTASYGTTVSVPVTLTESLSGLVTVKLSNEYGSTPLTRATLFCGTPTPRPPYYTGNVTYDGTAGCFNLSWSPNRDISGTTGGSVVNADLTYELTRYPDGKVITTEPGATTLSDPYVFPDDDFRIVYYELRSVYHGAKSNPARSNTLSFGTINPPYVNEMMNSTGAAAFSYLPTASDNLQWSYIGAVTEQEKQHGWMNHGAANSATPMDSYLVLNGMRLQKGKVYTLAFTAACTNTSWRNERMAVYLGDKVTESGLRKQTLIEPTLVYSRREENGERHTCNFSVEEDGVYYLSFHHCSDPNLRYLYIGDISISAPIDGAVPSEVTGLDVKAAAGGKLSATLSFTMPAKSVDGKPLEEPAHVRIIRNEEQIADMLPSGTTCTYTDDKAANGINNYVVIPYNSKGEGLKSGVNVFVGVGKPRNPQPRAWYGTDDGTAIISWQPSDSDEFGTALDASNVRYEIQRVTEENGKTVRTVIADGITGLTYDDHFCAPEAEQTAVSWYVRAVTDGGNSQWVGTRHLGLGKPDTAPWKESFTDGKVHHNWFTAGQDVRWGPITDEVYDDAKSVDADNGLMVCVASKAGSATLLYSGPVVIPADMERPELSFYFFNQDKYQGVAVKNFIELAIMNENGQTHVKKAVCNGPWGWERMAWNMDEYRGKKIQVGVYAECIDRPSILLDAFRIAPRYDNDIDMVTLAGPSEIEAGTDAVFTVTYENLGSNDIPAGYKVRLFRGGELIAEKDGPAVKADAKATVTFTAATNPTMNSPLFFKAAVALDCDGNPSNNESNTLTLELVKNTGYPVPRDLTADGSDTAVALKWESPDMSTTPRKTYTEDFEKFDSFAKEIPDWTIIDADKGIVAPISNYIQIPETWGSAFGFFVQDNSVKPFNEYEEFTPCSGHKYMASQYVTDASGNGIPNDDWLISPELSGDAQVASFMGKSISSSWPESFEVYYSETGTEISDFTLIGGVVGAPSSWIHYTAYVPAGARYFAIRCNSNSCLQFMVDDVTLRLKSCDPIELTFGGYNIYRDGTKLNDAPVAATEYTDASPLAGKHTYMVTTVYKEGESDPSNASDVVGAEGIADGKARVSGATGYILVSGAEGMEVTVYDLSGAILYDGQVGSEARIGAAPGVYVVTVAGKSHKVIVR